MPLKFDWITPITRLTALPYTQAADLIEIAEWFVDRVAPFAEHAGWQPVHLFKPPGGLLYRWSRLDDLGHKLTFPSRSYLGVDIGGHYFLYRAHRDGSVTIVTGPERAKILGIPA